MRGVALSAALAVSAAGHGQLTFPPSRTRSSMAMSEACERNVCHWFNQGCQIGCPKCTDTFSGMMCASPMEPTIGDLNFNLLTWLRGYGTDKTARYNPWRAPGFAPVFSPCGISGGGKTYHPSNGADPADGYANGFDGRDLPELDGVKTEWVQGSVQEVAWQIKANHGGGYAYRLCPKSNGKMDEACFQQNHLQFASSQSWVQYGTDKKNRTAFTATRVDVGTSPSGSQWTRNPLPACGNPTGGVENGVNCTFPAMFDPVIPVDTYQTGVGAYGYGGAACFGGVIPGINPCTKEQAAEMDARFNFNIIDTVTIPNDLPVGEYFLSFRWDCEQTPQVWAQCADVTVTSGVGPSPPAPPAPGGAEYACIDSQCTPTAGGIPLATCQKVCSPAALYVCKDAKCAPATDGIDLATCQKVCK